MDKDEWDICFALGKCSSSRSSATSDGPLHSTPHEPTSSQRTNLEWLEAQRESTESTGDNRREWFSTLSELSHKQKLSPSGKLAASQSRTKLASGTAAYTHKQVMKFMMQQCPPGHVLYYIHFRLQESELGNHFISAPPPVIILTGTILLSPTVLPHL